MSQESKIFCIGLNKTGTTSIHKAFELLGLSSVHFKSDSGNIKKIIKDNHEGGRPLLAGISQYKAYSDWNVASTNHLYKELDLQHPNSKFILTTRDMEGWLKSREKHVMRNFSKRNNPTESAPIVNLGAWREEFEAHHLDVQEYFKNRPGDLLIFDVTKGDEWKKLCAFIGVGVPSRPFPKKNRANKSTESSGVLHRVRKFFRL